mgnify:CR=1 FL=1
MFGAKWRGSIMQRCIVLLVWCYSLPLQSLLHLLYCIHKLQRAELIETNASPSEPRGGALQHQQPVL